MSTPDMTPSPNEPTTRFLCAAVLDAAAKAARIEISELMGSRRREATLARDLAAYVLRTHIGLTVERIASIVGVKSHSTVLYGVTRVGKGILEAKPQYVTGVREVVEELDWSWIEDHFPLTDDGLLEAGRHRRQRRLNRHK